MRTIKTNAWYRMGFITVALAVIAMSINMFFAPHGVAAGGSTGIAIILYEVWHVPVAMSTMVINVALLLLAYFLVDRSTSIRILYGSLMLPLIMAVLPITKVVEDKLLAILVGSVLIAVGFAMLYMVDASSGGTTVPPLILKKHFGIKTENSLFVIDVAVSSLNIIVSGWEAFILAAFSLLITRMVMNYIATGLDRKRMLHVVSERQLPTIMRAIESVYGDLVTTVLVAGDDEGDGRDVLLVVTDQPEYKDVVLLIHKLDSRALIISGEVADVHDGQ
ncbi:integral membrane protein [Lacticaseibacillus pantheris DSM 15945 = JCM 12539 = NBRC 106106]|uniref:Integral membrane protein n=1 Tax=Lacticaseibacillus pantheris DSM 15945 = JCM 12539 = NBRC 106106 TaxID=1423783 RepID=A0A0R1U0J4_9LACO|nr:YitT family protein [Lacticaseibacillus pantheris]KRL84402.1 integral membrane protein [Lacticaseibacillus pantheris DSM 15945 = JCM 12539 = NBRC 106106]